TENIIKSTTTLQKSLELMSKRMDSFENEMRLLREETSKRMDSFEKSLELMSKRMDSFENEMRLLREETSKRMDSFEKSLELMSKRMDSFEKSLELMSKRMDSFERSLLLLTERMDSFDRAMEKLRQDFNLGFGALGARWGFAAEESFREAIRGILGEMGFTVDKWEVYDERGVVFNVPSIVETDVLIRDDKHILVEIKSSISMGDVAAFIRKSKLYEELAKVKPSLVVISPFVEEEARERARMEKIKVYTRVREFKPA
ncbi:MAG: DUF3782 domain-containing protein, partial [Candidatus Jordarchaeaceae archaeon]